MISDIVSIYSFGKTPKVEPVQIATNLGTYTKNSIEPPYSVANTYAEFADTVYEAMDVFERATELFPQNKRIIRDALQSVLMDRGYDPILGLRLINAVTAKLVKVAEAKL